MCYQKTGTAKQLTLLNRVFLFHAIINSRFGINFFKSLFLFILFIFFELNLTSGFCVK